MKKARRTVLRTFQFAMAETLSRLFLEKRLNYSDVGLTPPSQLQELSMSEVLQLFTLKTEYRGQFPTNPVVNGMSPITPTTIPKVPIVNTP